ncbi:MAG: hypothetical protein R2725_10980 [Solirubrobacterales bacterium]
MTKTSARIRTLPDRYGKRALIALAAIVALGLAARAYVVVNPVANPADDSHAYYDIAKALYVEGSFGSSEFNNPSDWSPGAPLLYAAAFYATGSAREGTARIVEALMGAAAIVVVFLLARRLALATRVHDSRARAGIDPPAAAGLLAALGVAVYPPFIHSTGELMSEPPAILTLPAAVLAFLWASERGRSPWAWLVPGLLFGLTAMFRPEYLVVGAAFVVLAALSGWLRFGTYRGSKDYHPPEGEPEWRRGLAAALVLVAGIAVVVLPWTIRNAIVLDKVVPISTGGGKALYVGTFLPADGEYQRVKAILYERKTGIRLDPHSRQLDEVSPTGLFDEVAKARYPELPRDEALGKVGKENFSKFFGDDPLGYLGMTVRKAGRMWSSGVGEAMSSTVGRAVQIALVVLGFGGLVVLGTRRRRWELVVLATPIALVTLVGAATLAAPRRNEVLMTLVFPLAALALYRLAAAISSREEWSPVQASSPPS